MASAHSLLTLILLFGNSWLHIGISQVSADFCRVDTISGTACSFPFIYDNVEYIGCTTEPVPNLYTNGELWCSTSPNFDTDQESEECDAAMSSACGDFGKGITCDDATVNGDANGEPCVFPFEFNGDMYSRCVSAQTVRTGPSMTPWCATTMSYDPNDDDTHYGECEVLTEEGETCVFPFTYNGETFYECTYSITDNKYWCGIQADLTFPGDPSEWSYCILSGDYCPTTVSSTVETTATTEATTATTEATTATTEATTPAETPTETTEAVDTTATPAVVATTQTTVTMTDLAATTAMTADGFTVPPCPISTYEGNANGADCVFPFVYRGEIYYFCTVFDSIYNQEWCATTPDYDENSQWGYCGRTDYDYCLVGTTPTMSAPVATVTATAEATGTVTVPAEATATEEIDIGTSAAFTLVPPCRIVTEDGNANGADCVFPFTYNGEVYYTCTTTDSIFNRYWCSTTVSYDTDQEWGYCATIDYDYCLFTTLVLTTPGTEIVATVTEATPAVMANLR